VPSPREPGPGVAQPNRKCERFWTLPDKFRDFRKTGLASPDKESSLGNLLFKELRNRGVFERMNKFLRKRDDQSLSLEAVDYKTKINEVFREALLYKIEQALVEELEKHYEQSDESSLTIEDILTRSDGWDSDEIAAYE
jgi:hypothetical protein